MTPNIVTRVNRASGRCRKLNFKQNIFHTTKSACTKATWLLTFFFSFQYASAQLVPVITDVSPLSASVHDTVTITGRNFSNTLALNTVYIGMSRARIISSTTKTLVIEVQPGATSDYIRVTTKGLTSQSKKRFTVAFSSPEEISRGAFSSLISTEQTSSNTVFGDLDGDGKQDMAIINTRSLKPATSNLATVSINKNTSSIGDISFKLLQIFRLPDAYQYSVYLDDLNSDGKLDLIVSPLNQPFFYFYKNTSTADNIDFNSARVINVTEPLNLIRFIDIDGDGKEDLIMTDEGTVKIRLNIGTDDDIRYADPYVITLGAYFSATAFDDLNGDGKVDILVSATSQTAFPANFVTIMRNIGTRGNLSFEFPQTILTGTRQTLNAKTADIDLDGKIDIIATDTQTDSVAILKNKTIAPTVFKFGPPVKCLLSPYFYKNIKLQDLDADGRVDIVNTNANIDILRNTSTSSQISFAPKLTFSPGYISSLIDIKDIDGDGQPDLAVGYGIFSERPGTYILRNQMYNNEVNPHIISYSPSFGRTGDSIVINGSNFLGTREVSLGDSAVSNFTIVSDNQIIAIVGSGASGSIKVKSRYSWSSVVGFRYLDQPSLTIKYLIPDSPCQGEELFFTGVIINKPPNGYFRMVKNDVQLNGNSGIVSTILKEGDRISTRMYINNILTEYTGDITVPFLQPVVKPTIKISQSKNAVCKGSAVKFTATVTGAGSTPFFQWYKNHEKVGLNQATYTDSLLETGDSIFCVLDVANRCAIVPVESKSLGIVVYTNVPSNPSSITGPSTVSAGQQGISFSIDPVNEVQSYSWLIPSGTVITSGKGTNAITMNWDSTPGKISIKLTNACGSSSVVTKTVTISSNASRLASSNVEKELKLTAFSIYPNPANTSTTVEFSGSSDRRYFVQLHDATGKILQSQKVTMVKGRIITTLNTSNYTPGVYYVVVTNELNQTVSKRLLIGK